MTADQAAATVATSDPPRRQGRVVRLTLDPSRDPAFPRFPSRAWFRHRWRESPCWAASFVVHFLLLSVLAAANAKLVAETVRPLLFTWSNAQSGEQVALENEPELIANEFTFDDVDSAREGKSAAEPKQLQTESPDRDPTQQDPAALIQGLYESRRDVYSEMQTADLAAISQDLHAQAVAFEVDTPGTLKVRVSPETKAEQDEVVAQFIQYDIGKLPGREGLAARDAFHRLGVEALPSLVHGLNESAYISASCPVVVISGRVSYLLYNEGSPDEIEYAIEQIGRGVSKNAPHFERLQALKESLEQKMADLVADPDPDVSAAAHRYLVRRAGIDLGPPPNATPEQRRRASENWREWLRSGKIPHQALTIRSRRR